MISELGLIGLAEMTAIAVFSAAILDTFLWYIYFPAVSHFAKNFEPSEAEEDKQKRRTSFKGGINRKDISDRFRQAARNKSLVKKYLNRCMDYEKMMNDLHLMTDSGDKSELMNRCKRMIYRYQKVPELLSHYLRAYEKYLNDLTILLEQANDCWQSVKSDYQASGPKSEPLQNLDLYLADGSIVEYLENLADQYQAKAEWTKDLMMRCRANLWCHFKDAKLQPGGATSAAPRRTNSDSMKETYTPAVDNPKDVTKVDFKSEDEVLSYIPNTSNTQSQDFPKTHNRSYFVDNKRAPADWMPDDISTRQVEDGVVLPAAIVGSNASETIAEKTPSGEEQKIWEDRIKELQATLDEKTEAVENARKRHQQLKSKLILWKKVYIDFQTNCLSRHAPKDQPPRKGCGTRRATYCEVDDIYQPEAYAQEKLKLPELEEIAKRVEPRNPSLPV